MSAWHPDLVRWLAIAALLALAGSCRALPTVEDYKDLPGCEGADWVTYFEWLQRVECRRFYLDVTSMACPEACGKVYEALGSPACALEISRFEAQEFMGVSIPDDAMWPFVNATLEACQVGKPVEEEPMAKYYQAALLTYPSCAGADWAAVDASGCTLMQALQSLSGSLAAQVASSTDPSSGGWVCPEDCVPYLKAVGSECMSDFELGITKAIFGTLSDTEQQDFHATFRSLFKQCVDSLRLSRKMKALPTGAMMSKALIRKVAAAMAAVGAPGTLGRFAT